MGTKERGAEDPLGELGFYGFGETGRGMGFRNLHEFNLALLAKQCWLLIQEPNSLWARLIQARYFQDCSFFMPKKKGNRHGLRQGYLQGETLFRRAPIGR